MVDFAEVDGSRLELNLHEGQTEAWRSTERVVAVIAGTQAGKTCFGPAWLWREITRCGPGDYLVVTPTFKLLELKALPEFKRLFEDYLSLGKYKQSPVRVFEFSEAGERRTFGTTHPDTPTKVYFGYADDPDSLESATAKAAWLDEAGQKKFRLGSWEAVQRRLGIHQGRTLITTTPYNLGWLKQQVYDPWRAGEDGIEVVRFESIQNPAFPEEEFRRAKRSLPRWKFDMFYRGVFTRPAGLIYDAFDPDRHIIPRFEVPEDWPRFWGLDFGGTNTAAMLYARDPAGKLIAYREYHAGGRTAGGHAQRLRRGEPKPSLVAGGAPSEGQWRREFADAGLEVTRPAVSDVEVGIDRVYAHHATDRLYVFDDLDGYLEQKQTYARELDDNNQPTAKIEDKERFHLLDAERYILSTLAAGVGGEAAMVHM